MFAVALLASGLSSSSVGTYAGEVIMAGFIRLIRDLMRAVGPRRTGWSPVHGGG